MGAENIVLPPYEPPGICKQLEHMDKNQVRELAQLAMNVHTTMVYAQTSVAQELKSPTPPEEGNNVIYICPFLERDYEDLQEEVNDQDITLSAYLDKLMGYARELIALANQNQGHFKNKKVGKHIISLGQNLGRKSRISDVIQEIQKKFKELN